MFTMEYMDMVVANIVADSSNIRFIVSVRNDIYENQEKTSGRKVELSGCE